MSATISSPPDTPTDVASAVRPIALLLVAYPLWWALGIQIPMWALAGIPVLLWLAVNRRAIVLPPGYGPMVLFLGWVVASALMVGSAKYAAAYSLRLMFYTLVTAMGILVWNALARGLPGQRVVTWLVAVWAAAILLAYPGVVIDNLQFTSPFEWLMRVAGVSDPYLIAVAHPEFSEFDGLYQSPRPSPLFPYTNDWGAAVGILMPVAIYALVAARRTRDRIVLLALVVAAVPPILYSLNRGAWITIGAAIAYVVVRRAATGDLRPLAALGGLVAVVATTILVVTPLRETLLARFEYGNTSTRAALYEAAWGLALRSPLLGWGAPQSSEGLADSNDASIGTHGQMWTILVSQGIVGFAIFVAAILALCWHSRPVDGRSAEVWLHATGPAVLLQTAFYEVLPMPLMVALLCLAVCHVHRLRALGRLPPALAAASQPIPPIETRKATENHV